MRSFNFLRNAFVSILYELIIIGFGLVVPRLIIGAYGSEVNGLASTINNVLHILTLLQAGAAGASIFQMFKPVAEKDYEKISIIMDSSRRYFCLIGSIFMVLVFAVSPLFGLLAKSESVSFSEKLIAFLILGANGSLYIFFVSYFDVLFSSHQKRFVIYLAGIIDKIVYYGLIILIVLLKLDFMLMYVVAFLATAVRIVVLYIIYQRTYKPLIKRVPKSIKFKIPNKGYLLCTQISMQLITSVPTIILSMASGLAIASVFAVYYLVYNTVKIFINIIQLSVNEVFGNFVVTKTDEEVQKTFSLLDFVFAGVGVILIGCVAFLYQPFIYVYTDFNNLDYNYMYPLLSFVVAGLLIFSTVNHSYSTLVNVKGYYKETYVQNLVFACIGTALSIGLMFVEWPLVVIGPAFYYAGIYVYNMYICKRKIAWVKISASIRRLIALLTITVGAFVASHFIFPEGNVAGWGTWILYALLCVVAIIAVLAIYVLIFERREIKSIWSYIKTLLAKLKGKKKVKEQV